MSVLKIRHVGEILDPSRGDYYYYYYYYLQILRPKGDGPGGGGCAVFIKSNQFDFMHECSKNIYIFFFFNEEEILLCS